MKKIRVLALICMMMLCRASGQVQPANFMIGEFTFQRPSHWKWIDVQGPNEKARLYIFDEKLQERAIVSFDLFDENALPFIVDKWKEPYLSHEPPPEVALQTNHFGNFAVVTADIFGTKNVGKGPATNQATHGLIVNLNQMKITARILGARPLVEKLKPAFSAMVQAALKGEE